MRTGLEPRHDELGEPEIHQLQNARGAEHAILDPDGGIESMAPFRDGPEDTKRGPTKKEFTYCGWLRNPFRTTKETRVSDASPANTSPATVLGQQPIVEVGSLTSAGTWLGGGRGKRGGGGWCLEAFRETKRRPTISRVPFPQEQKTNTRPYIVPGCFASPSRATVHETRVGTVYLGESNHWREMDFSHCRAGKAKHHVVGGGVRQNGSIHMGM